MEVIASRQGGAPYKTDEGGGALKGMSQEEEGVRGVGAEIWVRCGERRAGKSIPPLGTPLLTEAEDPALRTHARLHSHPLSLWAGQSQLRRISLQRLDDKRNVFVERHAQLFGAMLDVLARNTARESLVLHLLAHR